MSVRASQFTATVADKDEITPHLVRLQLVGADGFVSTGSPDEWIGLIVPGQFQSRYYTVRGWSGEGASTTLEVDVVVHPQGLVTEWASGDCVGEVVTLTEPKGSFAPPDDAEWLMLVGDLTALPAMSRIARETSLPTRIWAETGVADPGTVLAGYLPQSATVTWLPAPVHGSALADTVSTLEWPVGPGYFWMAGESAQMRAIRKHLMRERRLRSEEYAVMGYWRASLGRQPRAVDRMPTVGVDPGPIHAAGKAAGKSDAEIWADYDKAVEESQP